MSLEEWEECQKEQQKWYEDRKHLLDAMERGHLVVLLSGDRCRSLGAANSLGVSASEYTIVPRPKPPEPPKGAEPKYRPFKSQMEAVRHLCGKMVAEDGVGLFQQPSVSNGNVCGASFDYVFRRYKITDGYKTWPCGVRINEDGTDYVE